MQQDRRNLIRLRNQLFMVLSLNAAIIICIALLPITIDFDAYKGTFLEKLNMQGKLHRYCENNKCSINPNIVSISYMMQGLYASILTFISIFMALYIKNMQIYLLG